jgi:hypothetical protein
MNKIQLAFMQAMRIIAIDLGLTLSQMNLWIRFDENGTPTLIARHGNKILKKIQITQLIKPKMIGLRLCTKKLTHFLRCLHASYLMENKINNPCAVSLVLYASKTAQEICVGIYMNKTATKAFKISEVAELAGIGKAELN